MQIPNISIGTNRHEETAHGTLYFPFVLYESVMSMNIDNTIDWHWHEELQLCYVLHGCVDLYMNEKKMRLREGEGAFINSGFLHMTRAVDPPDSIYVCINFHARLLSSFSRSIFETRYVNPYLGNPSFMWTELKKDVPWQAEALNHIQQIYKSDRKRPFGYEYEIAAELSRIWVLLISHMSADSEPKKVRNKVKGDQTAQAIMNYIQNHYADDLSIEDIASDISFSTGECCRIFKRVTGDTIFSYLRSFRLHQSARLLRETNRSVSDIAYDCGFTSDSYYIAIFKKNVGMTPLQYRRQWARRVSEAPASVEPSNTGKH